MAEEYSASPPGATQAQPDWFRYGYRNSSQGHHQQPVPQPYTAGHPTQYPYPPIQQQQQQQQQHQQTHYWPQHAPSHQQQYQQPSQWSQHTPQQGYNYAVINPEPARAYQQHTHAAGSGYSSHGQSGVRSTGSTVNCFNCGTPGHWAQHCPHPRRAHQAGKATAVSPTPASQGIQVRPRPPVVTRYQVPEHVRRNHTPMSGSPMHYQYQQHQPWRLTPHRNSQQHQQKSPPYASHNGPAPPTPISANSPVHTPIPPWRAPSHPQDSLSYPSGPLASPQSAAASPQKNTATPKGPLPLYIPHPPPPLQIPTVESPAHPEVFHRELTERQQQGKYMSPPLDAVVVPTHDIYSLPPKTTSFHKRNTDSVTPATEDSRLTGPITDEVDEEEDLSLLDVPDLPTHRPEDYGNKACRLLSMPLLAQDPEEAPRFLPEPLHGGSGIITSRFITPKNLTDTLGPIRSSSHFSTVLNDPAFTFKPLLTHMAPSKRVPGRQPPPPPPPAPPSTRDADYKIVSNAPAVSKQRETTPIPEVGTSGSGTGEFDPFDPNAESAAGNDKHVPPGAVNDPWSVNADISLIRSGNKPYHDGSDERQRPEGRNVNRKRSHDETFDHGDSNPRGQQRHHSEHRRKQFRSHR